MMMEVLVVDDDAMMRELLCEWLSDAGYRVRQAEHGNAALQMLRKHAAAILITDMEMPGRDGAQTLSEARRLVPGLPVIAMSGATPTRGQNWAETALGMGAAKTLSKPFGREELLAAMEAVAPRDRRDTREP